MVNQIARLFSSLITLMSLSVHRLADNSEITAQSKGLSLGYSSGRDIERTSSKRNRIAFLRGLVSMGNLQVILNAYEGHNIENCSNRLTAKLRK